MTMYPSALIPRHAYSPGMYSMNPLAVRPRLPPSFTKRSFIRKPSLKRSFAHSTLFLYPSVFFFDFRQRRPHWSIFVWFTSTIRYASCVLPLICRASFGFLNVDDSRHFLLRY